jgi:hypothetical protein
MNNESLNLTTSDWTQARWGAALRRVPALLLILGVALAFHQPAAGVVSAGASLSVGLVLKRQVAGSSWWAMITTSLVMAFSAWVGTLAGASPWLAPLLTATWGLAFAFFAVHDDDSGWIAMQGVITLVIAIAFPSHGYAALDRAAAVLIGGMVQIAIVLVLSIVRDHLGFGASKSIAEGKQPASRGYKWNDFFRSFTLFSAAWKYAVRVAITMIIAVEVARFLGIQNGYWLPMTTIIILKPDFYRTYSGAVQRVAGTFVGVSVASLIAHLFHPGVDLLLVLVAIFSFGCFALLKVNPILFSAALTAYVVFLIAITGLPETAVTGHRLILTALGSALALGSRFLGYNSVRVLLREAPVKEEIRKPAPVVSHGSA